jgi:hypothetical protein
MVPLHSHVLRFRFRLVIPLDNSTDASLLVVCRDEQEDFSSRLTTVAKGPFYRLITKVRLYSKNVAPSITPRLSHASSITWTTLIYTRVYLHLGDAGLVDLSCCDVKIGDVSSRHECHKALGLGSDRWVESELRP